MYKDELLKELTNLEKDIKLIKKELSKNKMPAGTVTTMIKFMSRILEGISGKIALELLLEDYNDEEDDGHK
jgi:sugar-specific transcriptional regulator TrmB